MAFTRHHLIFLLPLLPLLAVAVGGGGCPASDASSLLAFKYALSDPFGHLVSWSAAVDCCLWSHISCDATGVASLRLAGLLLLSSDKHALAPLTGLTNLVSLDPPAMILEFCPSPPESSPTSLALPTSTSPGHCSTEASLQILARPGCWSHLIYLITLC